MIPADKSVSIRSVLIWGLLNGAILAIGAAGFPLWAHHPFPRESLAFYELICAQVLLSSLTFPLLAKTRWTFLINLALILPMDELGGLLSNLSQMQILRSVGGVELWIGGLGLCAWMAIKERTHLMIIAAATCFTIGGAILDYLRWETSAIGGQANTFAPLNFMSVLCDFVERPSSPLWVEASLPLLLALIGLLIAAIRKGSSTSLHKPA